MAHAIVLLLLPCMALAARRPCREPLLASNEDFGRFMRHGGRDCSVFKRVCFEPGALVTYDPALVTNSTFAMIGIRSWPADKVNEFYRHAKTRPNEVIYGSEYEQTKLVVRLPSDKEWQHMLHHKNMQSKRPDMLPFFSTCTVPYVSTGHFTLNLAEWFIRTAALTYVLQSGVLSGGMAMIDPTSTIVMSTLGALPLAPWQRVVMQAFSTHRPVSLTTFSNRHKPSKPSNYTGEGVWGTRCFEKALFCQFSGAHFPGVVPAGQRVVRYNKPHFTGLLGKFWAQPNTQAAPGAAPGKVLHVLFELRTGVVGTRQILNLQQILQECSSFTGWAELLQGPNSTRPYTSVLCKAHAFGTSHFAEDLAVLQETDVLVAPHGAGMLNSAFLPKHASLVELRPFQFGTKYSHQADLWWPQICKFQRFFHFCWFLNIDEDGSYEDGGISTNMKNQRAAYGEGWEARDRNIRLKMSYLKFLLPKIVAMHKRPDMYSSEFWGQRVAFTIQPNGTIETTFTTKGNKEYFEQHKTIVIDGLPPLKPGELAPDDEIPIWKHFNPQS